MDERERTWNLTSAEWSVILTHVRASDDPLEDGAIGRVEPAGDGSDAISFYATDLSKPDGWAYPIAESLPGVRRPVTAIGQAAHNPDTGFVEFDISVAAAGQAIAADYEGGALDLDELSFEHELIRAMAGTVADHRWLMREFDRLMRLVETLPAGS